MSRGLQRGGLPLWTGGGGPGPPIWDPPKIFRRFAPEKMNNWCFKKSARKRDFLRLFSKPQEKFSSTLRRIFFWHRGRGREVVRPLWGHLTLYPIPCLGHVCSAEGLPHRPLAAVLIATGVALGTATFYLLATFNRFLRQTKERSSVPAPGHLHRFAHFLKVGCDAGTEGMIPFPAGSSCNLPLPGLAKCVSQKKQTGEIIIYDAM